MLLGPTRFVGMTFAEPGDSRSIGDILHDGFLHESGGAATEADQAYADLLAASGEQARLAGLTSSRTEALAEAAQNRIDTVQRVAGVQLENPFRQGYLLDAERRYDEARARGEAVGPRALWVRQAQRDIFNEKVDALATAHPDKIGALTFGQSFEEQAGAIASNAEDAATLARRHYQAAGGGAFGEFTASLLGGLWGARRDPLSIVSLGFGPGAASGSTIVGRVATAAAAQGLFNLGLQAVERPAVRAWREERGRDPGSALPSLEEAGLSFALGAIPGAGIQGALEVAGVRALRRFLAGEAKPGDLGPALRTMGVPKGDIERILSAGLESDAADQLAIKAVPPGVADADHAAALAQAIRHADDPAAEPPPPRLASVPEGTTDDAARAALDGSSDPLAAVDALRADPKLVESALSSARSDVQTAGRLASLSDEALAMVRDGRADPATAAMVAELSPRQQLDAQVLDHVVRAQPQSMPDARLAAADAIETESRRAATEQTRQALAPTTSEAPTPRPSPQGGGEHAAASAASRDVLDHVPLQREDGSAVMVARGALAKEGEAETHLAELVRACK